MAMEPPIGSGFVRFGDKITLFNGDRSGFLHCDVRAPAPMLLSARHESEHPLA